MVRNLFPCLYTHAHALKPKLQGFYFLWGRWGSPLAHHFFLDSSQDTQTTIRSGSIRGLGYKSCILPTTCRARRMATGTRHLLLLRLSHSALVVSALQADKADTFFIRLQLHSVWHRMLANASDISLTLIIGLLEASCHTQCCFSAGRYAVTLSLLSSPFAGRPTARGVTQNSTELYGVATRSAILSSAPQQTTFPPARAACPGRRTEYLALCTSRPPCPCSSMPHLSHRPQTRPLRSTGCSVCVFSYHQSTTRL
ncbi:hypothetical protein TREES_T100011691 [Tupaia chinensis]|uniref:Uncharacterized protein n=1 Tax=Tupaia chinensis TaxID=246437 RepID=L9L1C0_TUPCH|nr:hypothetical protein TREES_T100011691 [Tupaia chinensis]